MRGRARGRAGRTLRPSRRGRRRARRLGDELPREPLHAVFDHHRGERRKEGHRPQRRPLHRNPRRPQRGRPLQRGAELDRLQRGEPQGHPRPQDGRGRRPRPLPRHALRRPDRGPPPRLRLLRHRRRRPNVRGRHLHRRDGRRDALRLRRRPLPSRPPRRLALPADDPLLPRLQRRHRGLLEAPQGDQRPLQEAPGRGEDQEPARERPRLRHTHPRRPPLQHDARREARPHRRLLRLRGRGHRPRAGPGDGALPQVELRLLPQRLPRLDGRLHRRARKPHDRGAPRPRPGRNRRRHAFRRRHRRRQLRHRHPLARRLRHEPLLLPAGVYYTIPYRSLLPKDFDNLVVAGRCIGATHEAQASIRIMPICICIGEAAGTAAALAKKAGVAAADVDTDALRARLREKGAFVG